MIGIEILLEFLMESCYRFLHRGVFESSQVGKLKPHLEAGLVSPSDEILVHRCKTRALRQILVEAAEIGEPLAEFSTEAGHDIDLPNVSVWAYSRAGLEVRC